MVAMTLAVFDVSTCIENGIEIIPEVDPSPEMLRYDLPVVPSRDSQVLLTCPIAIPSPSSVTSSLGLSRHSS